MTYSKILDALGYFSVNDEDKFRENIVIFDEIEDDAIIQIIAVALQDRIKVYYHTRDHREDYIEAKKKEKASIRSWKTEQKKLDHIMNTEIPQTLKLSPSKKPIHELLTDMAADYLSKPYTNEIKAIKDSI